MTGEEMVGWYHQLNGHEFSRLREMVKDSLVFMGSQSNTTWRLNKNNPSTAVPPQQETLAAHILLWVDLSLLTGITQLSSDHTSHSWVCQNVNPSTFH